MSWIMGVALVLIVIGMFIIGQILEAIKDEVASWSRSDDAYHREMKQWLDHISARISEVESKLRSPGPPSKHHEFD